MDNQELRDELNRQIASGAQDLLDASLVILKMYEDIEKLQAEIRQLRLAKQKREHTKT
jgi:hypothetical protein